MHPHQIPKAVCCPKKALSSLTPRHTIFHRNVFFLHLATALFLGTISSCPYNAKWLLERCFGVMRGGCHIKAFDLLRNSNMWFEQSIELNHWLRCSVIHAVASCAINKSFCSKSRERIAWGSCNCQVDFIWKWARWIPTELGTTMQHTCLPPI